MDPSLNGTLASSTQAMMSQFVHLLFSSLNVMDGMNYWVTVNTVENTEHEVRRRE